MRANYKVELASGIFLLLGIAALVWLATRATDYGQDIGKETYSITARFDNVGDLRDRAPVKIGGVTVGLVESIALDPVSFEAVVQHERRVALRRDPLGYRRLGADLGRARGPLHRAGTRRRPGHAGGWR